MTILNSNQNNIKETVVGRHTIAKEDVEFICIGSEDNDDACELLVMQNYHVSDSLAWDIIESLRGTYGRK